jgi:signal transduction histidine kinase
VKLRTQLSALVGLVTILGVGTTGGILVFQSHRSSTEDLIARQELVAQRLAESLRSNLDIVSTVLSQIQGEEQINFADNDPAPEKLLLHDLQTGSVFNHTVVLLDVNGACVWAEPPLPEHEACDVGSATWFQRVRTERQAVSWVASEGPDDGDPATVAPGEKNTLVGVVVPVMREGQFVGALEGIIELGSDKAITPVLHETMKYPGEVALVDTDADGAVVEAPTGVTMDSPGWRDAYDEALGEIDPATGERDAGTFRAADPSGNDSLYAFAPVGLFGFEVICRWNWRGLDTELSRQFWILLSILAAGAVLSLTIGVLFSQGLSRPLQRLAGTADQLAGGEFSAATGLDTVRRDEIGALHRAFRKMGTSLGERDARIREDLDEIRRIAADKERLYKEVQELAASLEQRVDERTRQLRDAQDQLVHVERFAAMGKTAAVLAHEVKNALNGIGGLVDLILGDVGPTARAQRLRGQLRAEITRLADLTENLLAFSRAPRIVRAPEDLHSIVRRSLDALSEALRDGDIDLEVELQDGGAPLIVPCDGHKIQGAMMNLLKNAIEAVAAKPVLDLHAGGAVEAVEGSRGRVRVVTRRQVGPAGEEAIVEVGDSGSGLATEVRDHLFEPFYTTKPSGTGLGLATARRYLEAHGGRVEVDPGPGPVLSGACIRLCLPLAELSQKDGEAATSNAPPDVIENPSIKEGANR